MKVANFTPILIQYNEYNGFTFELLHIEAETDNRSFNGSLLGLHIHSGLSVELCFFWFDIKSPIHW